jgi:signal transduction histidine kinase
MPLVIKQVIGEYNGNDRILFTAKGERRVFVDADYERIKLVLRNVIDNALKYSSGKVDIYLRENEESVLISVRDKGVGIPEKDLKYIFEPFYRSDPSRSRRTGGFGLGLSICKKVMDAHKGKIEISSTVNEGTEVVITFPK